MSMKTIASGSRNFRFVVLAALAGLIFQPVAYAEMVSTEQLVTHAQSSSKKAELRSLLSREDLRTQMTNLGVNVADAEDRINSMTDAELNQALAGLNDLPAGADVLGGVLTVLLILVILDIAGVTDIFPGV